MTEEVQVLEKAASAELNRQQTAKKAARILAGKNIGFIVPTPKQKNILLVAFAMRNLVIYGRGFDALKLTRQLNLDDPAEVRKHLDCITLYEIKSTNKKRIGPDFRGYFFALTTAELLVAQNLKDRYRFVFVNIITEQHLELKLVEVFAWAKGIYPTWSIAF